MGLFGRLFGKKRGVVDDSFLDAEIDALKDGQGQPRFHHYLFAHVKLRAIAYHMPIQIVMTLGSDQCEGLLRRLWESVNEDAAESGESQLPYPEAICVHPRRVGKCPVAVVEMPQPQFITECHMIAVVLNVDAKDMKEVDPATVEAEYFTLEKGMSLDGTPRTVLGGWSKDGTHFNMGDGPAPEVDAFLRAIGNARD